MKQLAVLSCLFDYPLEYEPLPFSGAKKYIPQEDLFVARFNGLLDPANASYYDRLYYHKVVLLRDYIKEHILGKYDVLLFLDATDTNFYRDPKDLVATFKEFGCTVVFNAEKCLWPPTKYTHLYEEKWEWLGRVTDYRYLNSGAYIGYVDHIVYHMDEMIEKNFVPGCDDQGAWTALYLQYPDIFIDQDCKIFFSTLNSKEHVTLDENGKPHIHPFNPFIVHDNGPHTEDTIKLSHLLI